jgi:hypothetical protein
LDAKVTETPQGFLRVAGNLTRIGVLDYTRADGSTFRELRHPDEVFREDSLATLRHAPVTDLHGGMVTPENVQSLQVGLVTEAGHGDKFVTGQVLIQRKDAIDAVRSKRRCELSPGYRCWVDETPGEWGGQRYDGVQRNITYNHLAIGPRGWGRSGSEVALRMDGMGEHAAVERVDLDAAIASLVEQHPDALITVGGEPATEKGSIMKKLTLVLDGVAYEIEVAEPLAGNLESSVTKLKEKADSADAFEGKLDAADKTAKDLQAKLDDATSPAAIKAAVEARTALLAEVAKVAPELEVDEKLDAKGLKLAALVAAGHEIKADASDGYVDGRFAGAVAAAPKVEEKADEDDKADEGTRSAGPTPPEVKTDSDDDDKLDAGAARRRMIERNRNAFESKLDSHKEMSA